MPNFFLKKAVKRFKEAGIEHLINKEFTEEDIKYEILSNLFLSKDYSYVALITPAAKWIMHHLPKINKVFKEKPINDQLIKNMITIGPEISKRCPPNLSLMTNLFSKKNYCFYYVDKNLKIIEDVITKQDLKAAKKTKSEYKIIHDKETDNDFVYDLEYAKTIKMFHKPNKKKALAGIVTFVTDNICVAFIESFKMDFHSKLIASKAASNAINAAINKQIIAICIMGMIVQNNIRMANMNRMITMRRF